MLTAAIAAGALLLSFAISIISATWVLSRADRNFVSKEEMTDLHKETGRKIEYSMRSCGEGLAAIRTKIQEVEIWARDKIIARLAALEVKVETMWAFQMRRAISEVVEKGIGVANSPLHFTEQAIAALAPIKDELIAFNASTLKGKHDAEALLLIEAQFGERLLDLVCLPCKLTHGACLLLAYSIARQEKDMEIFLTPWLH